MADPLKIVECFCTEGFKGKIGPDIDTLRCEFGFIQCSIEEFPDRTTKKGKDAKKTLTIIPGVTVVKVNLDKQKDR